VEKVESFKFRGVHIIDKLKWITHTDIVVKKAQQCLFNLMRLKKCGLSPKTLTNFYRCTIENILSGCITTHNRRALDVTGRPKRSSKTTTTRATACSPCYHPEGEVSSGASKLAQRD
jgi:hypothetical protein